jgi:phosphoserine phosphatase
MPQASQPIVLVTVSGKDTPGITSELTGILSQAEATLGAKIRILDIGQAVMHRLLSLSILFEFDAPGKIRDTAQKTLLKELLFKASELGLKLEYQLMDAKDPLLKPKGKKPCHYAVTLIAASVSAQALHQVTAVLARFCVNIDIIKRLSEDEFSCVELIVSSPEEIDQSALKKELLAIAKQLEVDIALQTEGLYRRAKRLVVFDMDSTLIQGEVIDELAREHGVYDEVAAITHQAMNGRMNFDESLRLRCEKLKGLSDSELNTVLKKIQLTPGVEDVIHVVKKLGYKIALISGGFTFVADHFKKKLGLDFAYANTLEHHDGILSGRVIPPVVNAQRKADILELIAQQEKIELDQVIAIGDGANDLPMLERAGLGIAFNAKPMVREKADLALSQQNLRSLLYLLGLNGREVNEAISPSPSL